MVGLLKVVIMILVILFIVNSQCSNSTNGLTWFIINHSMVIKSNTLRYTIHIDLDLLTSNGLITKRRYYDFNDTACILNISV